MAPPPCVEMTLGRVWQDKDEVDFMMKRFDLYQTGDISFEEYCIMMSVPHDFLVKRPPMG
jgi:hypothetical protein